MTRRTKISGTAIVAVLGGTIAGALLLAGAAVLALRLWLPTDEELARQAQARIGQALGVQVRVGALRWSIWPEPVVELQDVATLQDQPLVARVIRARARLVPLLHRELALTQVEVEDARVPQLSLRAFESDRAEAGERAKEAMPADASGEVSGEAPRMGGLRLAAIPLETLRFERLTWISRRGVPVMYSGEIAFDESWRPRHARIERPGASPAADMTLSREGRQDHWQVRTRVGGGTLDGQVRLAPAGGQAWRLTGELAPRDIEVASTVRTFNRRAVIEGRGSGSTVLDGQGRNIAEIARSLHTRTRFTLTQARVLRFDLRRAIQTFGKDHAGQTPLDSLTGQMDTQNTGQGTVWSYTGLKAQSGAFTASGNVVIFARHIEARGAVDLVDGLVGAPIEVAGTLDKPQVSVPKGSIAGAAIGTAILPGIGTLLGARLGALLGGGAADAPDKPPPPVRREAP